MSAKCTTCKTGFFFPARPKNTLLVLSKRYTVNQVGVRSNAAIDGFVGVPTQ